MLELRKIRTYTPAGQNEPEAYDKGFEPAIYFKDLADFLANIKTTVEQLPEKERVNIYVTTNHVRENVDKRVDSWVSQDLIMWDIDDVKDDDRHRWAEYVEAVASTIKVDPANLVPIETGGGYHIVFQLKTPITSKDWFAEHSIHYQVLCSQINDKIVDKGLSGALDVQVFAVNRMFRAPFSISEKIGRGRSPVNLLREVDPQPVDWDIKKATGLPTLSTKDYMSDKELSYIKIDNDTVESGCEFLKWAKERPAELSEPQWYAMLSIIGRLPNGKERAHEYSKGHPGYNPTRTDRKLEQSLKAAGPRTCEAIDRIWGGCNKCPNYKKCRSPIALKGENFIATEHSGFHTIDPKGKLIPQYDDLRKYYDKKIPYLNCKGSHLRFEKTQWNEYDDIYIDSFAEENFVPKAKNTLCIEFRGKVRRTNLKMPRWFQESTDRRINFQNGVLNIDTMELVSHSPKFGFRDTLPFNYDPNAECPTFRQMLKDVTCNDVPMQTVLLEYLGYCISNDIPKADKILVLTGEGQNGKSRFLNVWRGMGSKGVRSLGVADIQNTFHLQQLDGGLFNIMEEVPAFADKDFWEQMKNLSAGGSVTASRKFKDPYEFQNRCKFIMTCNELPKGANPNHGYFRRLIICEFKARFSEELGNIDRDIDQRILESEMPGVANLALKAYKRLVSNNYNFTKSKAISGALEAYKKDMDNVSRWAEEHINTEADGSKQNMIDGPDWVQKDSSGSLCAVAQDMRKSYAQWCQDNGERPVNMVHFSRRLEGWLAAKKDSGYLADWEKRRTTISGRRVMAYYGFSFYDASKY